MKYSEVFDIDEINFSPISAGAGAEFGYCGVGGDGVEDVERRSISDVFDG